MEEIQTYYQIPSIAHFCNLFRQFLDLPDFDYEDLEFAFLSNISSNESDLGSNQINLILRLIFALLKGYFEIHINHSNWEKYLKKLFQIQWVDIEKKKSPFVSYDEKGEEIDVRFDDLPLRTKVEVIHCLCDYRLFKDDVSQLINDINAEEYRVEPLGRDSKGYNYWYFYGTRLYRENPTLLTNIELNYKKFDDLVQKRAEDIKRNITLGKQKEEQEVKKRKREEDKKRSLPPKVLGVRTGLRERKSEVSVQNGFCSQKTTSVSNIDSNKDFDNNKQLKEYDVSLSERQEAWSLVCVTEQDWKDLCQRFKSSKNKTEIEFYNLLFESFVPKISDIFEITEKEKSKIERQKLLDLLPRRISSRIELKKLKREKEEIEEEVTKRKDEELKDIDSSRQRSERIKQDREARAQRRLQLVEERAERALGRNIGDNADNGDNSVQAMDQSTGSNESHVDYINEEFIDLPECPANTTESFYEGLEKVISSVRSNRDAWPFADAVDRNKFPMYYQVIEQPIDLSIIEQKIESREYENFEQIENDFKLMVNNCETFNGPKNGYTLMAYGVWRAFKRASLKYLEKELSYDESNAFIYPQKPPNTNIKPAIEAKKKRMRNKRRSTFKALNVLAKAAEKAVEANFRPNASSASSVTESSCDEQTNSSLDGSGSNTSSFKIHGDMLAHFLFNANNTTNTTNANHNNTNNLNSIPNNTSNHENLTFKSLDEWSKSIKQSGNCVVLPQHAVIISSPKFKNCTNGPIVKSEFSLKVVSTGDNTTTNSNHINCIPKSFTPSVISNSENTRKELVNADSKRLVIKLSRCESGQVWRPVKLVSSPPNSLNTAPIPANTNQLSSHTITSGVQPFQGLRTIANNCIPVKKRYLIQNFNERHPITELISEQNSLILNTNGLTRKEMTPISQSFQITGHNIIQHNQNSNLKVLRLKKLDNSTVNHSNGLQFNQSPTAIPKVLLVPLERSTPNVNGLS